jgi:hypothetical protein
MEGQIYVVGNVNLEDDSGDGDLQRQLEPRLLRALQGCDPETSAIPGQEAVLAGVRMRFAASKDIATAPAISKVVQRAMGLHPYKLKLLSRGQRWIVSVTAARKPRVPGWCYVLLLLLVAGMTLTGLRRLFSAQF